MPPRFIKKGQFNIFLHSRITRLRETKILTGLAGKFYLHVLTNAYSIHTALSASSISSHFEVTYSHFYQDSIFWGGETLTKSPDSCVSWSLFLLALTHNSKKSQ